MRIGSNPEKSNSTLQTESYHRVVIPVYIPNLTEAYFKDGLIILKYCLDSLLKTIHSKTKISLINNGCCAEVKAYLTQIHSKENAIDQLFHSDINLGKVNAIYSAVKSNLEELITISDSDVFFLPGWQDAVEQVFVDFPKAGMVSPVPSSLAYNTDFVRSTMYYGITKRLLKFQKVKDPDGLLKFQESIGRTLYNDAHLDKYLTLTSKDKIAVVGCGHFVATLRAQVFQYAPAYPSNAKIVGGSENKYFDIPNDEGGFLRLATHGNYAYHLGNEAEPWMKDSYAEVMEHSAENNKLNASLNFDVIGISWFERWIGKLLFRFFVRVRPIKRWYFSLLGMKDKAF